MKAQTGSDSEAMNPDFNTEVGSIDWNVSIGLF